MLDEDGEKEYFVTYEEILAILKKQFPSGSYDTVNYVNGEHVRKTVTVKESALEDFPEKAGAWLDLIQDDSIYKFRVRAYHIEDGKKIYGPWSCLL